VCWLCLLVDVGGVVFCVNVVISLVCLSWHGGLLFLLCTGGRCGFLRF
jgi:hypothetical protein